MWNINSNLSWPSVSRTVRRETWNPRQQIHELQNGRYVILLPTASTGSRQSFFEKGTHGVVGRGSGECASALKSTLTVWPRDQMVRPGLGEWGESGTLLRAESVVLFSAALAPPCIESFVPLSRQDRFTTGRVVEQQSCSYFTDKTRTTSLGYCFESPVVDLSLCLWCLLGKRPSPIQSVRGRSQHSWAWRSPPLAAVCGRAAGGGLCLALARDRRFLKADWGSLYSRAMDVNIAVPRGTLAHRKQWLFKNLTVCCVN